MAMPESRASSQFALEPRTLGLGDRLSFFLHVALPTWAKGLLLQRRFVVHVAELFDLDAKAVRAIQSLRRRHGEGPLILKVFGKPWMLILAEQEAKHALDGAPEPFAPATREKATALSHFEPRVSLISRGAERTTRRRFHDEVLESAAPVHHLASRFIAVVDDEANRFLRRQAPGGVLTWDSFSEAWFRAVRRVVLGDQARDDRALTQMLRRLRTRANWVFAPTRKRLQRRYQAQLMEHLVRGEAGSLAAIIAPRLAQEDSPSDQVTQWLFAFDAGGITVWRALALLAAHPDQRAKGIQESLSGGPDRPFLRGCFLEAVRLWPTTPAILRELTKDVSFGGVSVPQGASLIVYTPFFHRDSERHDFVDEFHPELWLGKDPATTLPFIPFSAGPAACPGRHLVALLGSAWLAAMLRGPTLEYINGPYLGPGRSLPGTFDHFRLRFRITA